ncbi:MAG TPA: TonB-dependent receptor plug domain-containing protein, partial [Nitrospirota bacterium]|nr:TonB-dependent receptor plug domain-containing protein [Nitrospirota bacterium]
MIRTRVAALCTAACMLLPAAARADEGSVTLKEVVVTATRTEKQPQDVTQSATVITTEEIRKSGASSIGELIAETTGAIVNVQGPRGSLTEVKLRGSTSEQVLILLDGR